MARAKEQRRKSERKTSDITFVHHRKHLTLFRATAAYEDLKTKYDRLEDELAMRKRAQHDRKAKD